MNVFLFSLLVSWWVALLLVLFGMPHIVLSLGQTCLLKPSMRISSLKAFISVTTYLLFKGIPRMPKRPLPYDNTVSDKKYLSIIIKIETFRNLGAKIQIFYYNFDDPWFHIFGAKIEVIPFIQCVPTIFGPLWDQLWNISRPFLDRFLTISGQFLGHFWTFSGPFLCHFSFSQFLYHFSPFQTF